MSDFISNMRKGLWFHKSGKLDEAERFYLDALKTDPANEDLYNLIGLVAYEKGDDMKAAGMFRKAISINRMRADFYYNLGNALQASGENEDAAAAFRNSLMINPMNEKALNNLGSLMESTGDTESALKAYQTSLDINPTDPEIYFNAANLLSEKEDYDKAAEYYLKTIELNPENSMAFFNYANICRKKGNLDEAISFYEKTLAADPANADACCNMGNIFKLKGKIEKAFFAYQDALAINKNHVNALYNSGVLLQHMGNHEEALLFFEQTLRLDPSHPAAGHLAAAIKGNTTKRAPRKYLVNLFDEYSADFEKHTVEKLNYHAPSELRKLFDGVTGENRIFRNVLDIGCGTGLSGEAFYSAAEKINGIDISPKMLQIAETKNIYSSLANVEVLEFLSGTDEKYELFTATDVFVYMGFLEDIFAAVANASAPGAYFAFSIESSDGEDCVLRKTGRYAHSVNYIRKLAASNNFKIEKYVETGIRKAGNSMIPGYLFVLAKT